MLRRPRMTSSNCICLVHSPQTSEPRGRRRAKPRRQLATTDQNHTIRGSIGGILLGPDLEKTVGEEIRITAADGGTFAGYLALPARTPAPGLIVLPEIFNSNPHIRSVADGYAGDGFLALAPDVYWRQKAGSYLPYTDEGRAKAQALSARLD